MEWFFCVIRESKGEKNMEEKKDYGQTLNLPQTDFQMRGNLPEKEPKILEDVLEKGLYEKMLKKNEGKEPYRICSANGFVP